MSALEPRPDVATFVVLGRYRVGAGKAMSPTVRVTRDAYRGAADTLHRRTDAVLVDHPTARASLFRWRGRLPPRTP